MSVPLRHGVPRHGGRYGVLVVFVHGWLDDCWSWSAFPAVAAEQAVEETLLAGCHGRGNILWNDSLLCECG